MTKVVDCCVWCSKRVTHPAGFDPKQGVLVCSNECQKAEAWFRFTYSDEKIGEQNYKDFGVNPNHRGKKDGKV